MPCKDRAQERGGGWVERSWPAPLPAAGRDRRPDSCGRNCAGDLSVSRFLHVQPPVDSGGPRASGGAGRRIGAGAKLTESPSRTGASRRQHGPRLPETTREDVVSAAVSGKRRLCQSEASWPGPSRRPRSHEREARSLQPDGAALPWGLGKPSMTALRLLRRLRKRAEIGPQGSFHRLARLCRGLARPDGSPRGSVSAAGSRPGCRSASWTGRRARASPG